MSLDEQHKIEKRKPEYPLLNKIFKNDQDALLRLQAAFESEEIADIERHLGEESWDAKYVPSLLEEADKRIAEKVRGMKMAA